VTECRSEKADATVFPAVGDQFFSSAINPERVKYFLLSMTYDQRIHSVFITKQRK